ncbi:unnamed protein product, partial [Laminaria digitata]
LTGDALIAWRAEWNRREREAYRREREGDAPAGAAASTAPKKEMGLPKSSKLLKKEVGLPKSSTLSKREMGLPSSPERVKKELGLPGSPMEVLEQELNDVFEDGGS